MFAAAFLLALAAQDLGGGTQPGDLSVAIGTNSSCASCHSSATVPNLPNDTYRGTMMNLASYDPIFLAAWEIAFDDDAEVSGLCLRCHFPNGYLANRHEPHDGSNLNTGDREGIACDLCHRMEAPNDDLSQLLLSNTQVFIANETKKRGPYDDALQNGHTSEASPLFTDSRLCAQCHEVTNTLRPRVDLSGGPYSDEMPIERTYTEWNNSVYSVAGADFKTCMDCHMEQLTGQAAALVSEQPPQRQIRSHRIVGGNVRVPEMMQWMAGQAGNDAFFVAAAAGLPAVAQAAEARLQEAATLEATSATSSALTVRVTNQAGHKLPTGYAEGRRMFLQTTTRSADGSILQRTGTIDPSTSSFVPAEPAVKLWQIDLGVDGTPSFHFALVNQILTDNRIPPRGFIATADTIPVNATVQNLGGGSWAHWDDVDVPLPSTNCWPIVVDVKLWFQVASGEYFRFLRDNATENGPVLEEAWNAVGAGAPIEMESLTVSVFSDGHIEQGAGPHACEEPPPDEDAGVVVEDAGTDAGSVVDPPAARDGGTMGIPGNGDPPETCACATTTTGRAAVWALGVFALLRRRQRVADA